VVYVVQVYKKAEHIVHKLRAHGHTAYFAGGWVRDHVMGHDCDDIDIATSAEPQEILDLFSQTILVGLAFGVVVVVIDGHQYEVATFRKDLEYVNGRKPEGVHYCSAKEDALRRDFTINGMFYDPVEHEIIDYVGGVEDIDRGVIRTIGNPYERFREDRLRMIRAFRFAARFGFHLDEDMQEAIRANALTLFPPVAIERVWQEFKKMAAYPRMDFALIEMHRLDLLPVIFPELEGLHLNELKRRLLHFEHYPSKTPAILYLTALFPDSTLEEMLDRCRYLKMSREELRWVELYWKGKQLMESESQTDVVEWVYFFAKPAAATIIEVLAEELHSAEKQAVIEQIARKKQCLQKHIDRVIAKTPLVSGKDLKKHGIVSGIAMGELMRLAERLAIEQDLHDSEAVIAKLKGSVHWEAGL